jgi:hypothetical protein
MPSPAAIYDSAVAAYAIKQLGMSDYKPNYKYAKDRYSGGLSIQQVSIIEGDPVISLTTQDLAGVIANVSASAGLAVTSAGTIVFPWQDRDAGATFEAAATNHQTLSATLGLIVPTEINASQDSEDGATCNLEFYPASSDGLTEPVAINTGATLSAQAFVGSYDLGPVKVASTNIGNVESIKVNFGIGVVRKRYNGETWARIAGIWINLLDPTFEITFCDAVSAQAGGLRAAVASTVTAYLRIRAAGSTHTADASSAHIAITLTGGLNVLDGGSGNKQDDVTFTRTIIGKSLAFSSTSAIT